MATSLLRRLNYGCPGAEGPFNVAGYPAPSAIWQKSPIMQAVVDQCAVLLYSGLRDGFRLDDGPGKTIVPFR